MSDQVRSQRGRSTAEQPLTKAEKRAAAKAAKAAVAAAKRRRQVLTGVLAGLAVVAVVIAAIVLITAGDDSGDRTASTATGASSGATTPGFPPLPAGADPALARKPTTGGGDDGDLKKLTVTPLIEGKGAPAQAGRQITVNYVGVSYRTGEEFDASWDRAQPYSFQLGAGNVIPGWDQGLVGVRVGSRVQLDIPADLAYGEKPAGGRPAGPLRFVVDVLAVG